MNFPTASRPIDKIAKIQGGASVHRFARRPDLASLDFFTQGYIKSAFWTSDEELGDDASYDKMNVASIEKIMHDCEQFQRSQQNNLEEYFDHGFDEEQAGHDFWLTRNGHGTGFWDRKVDKAAAEQLSDAARGFGPSDLYWGDDKAIHVS